MKKNFAKPAALLIFAFAVSAAYANGLRVFSEDGFAAARGDAFAATADNASAIYYNPAGLTQIKGSELRGGIYGIYLDPTFVSPSTGDTYRIGKHYAFIPQIYLSHRLTNFPVAFGLGVFAPFGGSISWPQNTGFRADGTRASTTYLRINPTVALQIGEHLSIGAGLSANYADLTLVQGIYRYAAPFANNFAFSGDGWAAGGDAGILFQPWKFVSLGATVRSGTKFGLSGETSTADQRVGVNSEIPASAEARFPLTATFGVSLRPTPKWNFEFDADYAQWSSFDTLLIGQQSRPQFPVPQNVQVKLYWQDSWMYEFGVTRYFENGWHASAGYIFDENSVPDNYYTPLAADMDRHFFSIGIGRAGKTFDFDITYQLGYGSAHTVKGSSPTDFAGSFANENGDGTYKFISHAILVSAGIHF